VETITQTDLRRHAEKQPFAKAAPLSWISAAGVGVTRRSVEEQASPGPTRYREGITRRVYARSGAVPASSSGGHESFARHATACLPHLASFLRHPLRQPCGAGVDERMALAYE
jgi:hypothetical protein